MIKLDKRGLTQWDVGRYFNVSGVKEVHIANAGDSKAVVLSVADGKVPIPCFLLTTGKNVLAYAVDNGITVARYSFPVERKQRPENYVYDDDQRNYIYELIDKVEQAAKDSEALVAEVSAAVARADAAVKNADAAASRAEVRAEDAYIAALQADAARDNANTAANNAEEATLEAKAAAASIDDIAEDISDALDAIISIQESLMGFKKIIFFIAGTEYTAKDGMTWAEWVGSKYNTGGYIIHNGNVGWWEDQDDDGQEDWCFVEGSPSEVIEAGVDYAIGW